MALLAGILRTEDATLASTIAPREISGAINEVLDQYIQQRDTALRLFVAETVTIAEEHVPLTGIDEGQDVDRHGRALETRVEGGFDVEYPWNRRGWAHGWDHESAQYLTIGDIDKVTTAQSRGNAKWHLRSIHRALYNNVNYTHIDNETGTERTIRALANQDGTLYPAGQILELAEDTAEANHYLVSGYVSGDISGTNNPLSAIRTKLRDRVQGGGKIVAFINSANLIDLRDGLPNFIDAPATTDASPGPAESVANQAPGITVPGEYIGVDGDSNVHVYTYDATTPSGYILGQVVGVAPLKRRIPSVATLQGFRLEAEEETYPLYRREFRDRAGYAPYARLSAVVVQLKASGTYDVPAIYAR